jgi:hypothetical protein
MPGLRQNLIHKENKTNAKSEQKLRVLNLMRMLFSALLLTRSRFDFCYS